ncbi:TrkA C-terminal domain-containing protein [Flavobacterium ardleyense]|uniref:TrkA C-terminal domain-containing protein n=1 Tax=Flavobacterium ardleyense TaxID=2038737 RepID=UPI00298D44A4|nr:TrkA C-terminal domain-containing protein [Flavobacterium ardleyense]
MEKVPWGRFYELPRVVAKLLQIDMIHDALALDPPDLQIVDSVRSELQVIKIAINATAAGKKIVDLHFPDSTIVSMIERGENYIILTGSTIVLAEDILHIVSNDVKDMESIQNNLLKVL